MASLKKAYLIAYNAASATAWAVMLYRAATITAATGPASVGPQLDNYTRITQSFALMEILHSLLGIVHAPLMTTIMQVSSRILLVWGICQPFPELLTSLFFASMVLAWSTTEVIRYSYFALRLAFGDAAVPSLLHWMRYSGFLVLYPVGISSELGMVYAAWAGPAERLAWWFPWFLVGVFVAYVPGSVILYSHMMKQRKRNLSGGSSKARGVARS